MDINRGFFGIGIYHPKHEVNIGTLWRSAYQLGASFIFTILRPYKKQSSDTTSAWRHIPLFHYGTFDEFYSNVPYSTRVFAVETGGVCIQEFTHPERAIYILGAEDYGLPDQILDKASRIISIPSIRSISYNVSVAGSILMYDRLVKKQKG